MTAAAIRNKLCDYIKGADDKKVKALYTMLEAEIEQDYDHWQDEAFIQELNKRSEAYESGLTKGVPWKKAQERIKAKMAEKK